MASLATAIQYTIRSNLSVTIVAMVNNTEPHDSTDSLLLNETLKSKIVGCPLPDHFLNSSYKTVQLELKVIDFHNHAIQLVELHFIALIWLIKLIKLFEPLRRHRVRS